MPGGGSIPGSGATRISADALPELLRRPSPGLTRVEVSPLPQSWGPLKPALVGFARWYRERRLEPPIFDDVPLCLFGSEWPAFKNCPPELPARERCAACRTRRVCGADAEILPLSDAAPLQRWQEYGRAFQDVTGSDGAVRFTPVMEEIASTYRGPVSVEPSVLVSDRVDPAARFVVFPHRSGKGPAAAAEFADVLACARRIVAGFGSGHRPDLLAALGDLPPLPVPLGLDGRPDGPRHLKLYLRVEEKSAAEKWAVVDTLARFAPGMRPVPADGLQMLGLVLDDAGLLTVKAYVMARPTLQGPEGFPPPLAADHPLVALAGDQVLATVDVWCRGTPRPNKWDFNVRAHYLAGRAAERLVGTLAREDSAARLRPLLAGPAYRADVCAIGVRAGTLALYMELN